jgi:hypothetical protein
VLFLLGAKIAGFGAADGPFRYACQTKSARQVRMGMAGFASRVERTCRIEPFWRENDALEELTVRGVRRDLGVV